MTQLPVVSGMDARRAFERVGWKFVRVGSSRHMILRKAGSRVTLSIPDHKELDRGLLRSLIRDADMTIEEFVNHLKQ